MLDNIISSTLPIAANFSLHTTEYEWRDVTVNFKPHQTVRCRVPKHWSHNAANTLMSKYAVRTGVPDDMGGVNGREVDAERIFDRLVAGWRAAAIEHDYWTEGDPNLATFCAEIKAMLEQQIAAPNSPQWFNTGVAVQYGITAGTDGHYYATVENGEAHAHECSDSLAHPQISACFIQSVDDKLIGDGGIMDLWVREARLFKFGSGTGSNFSALRGKGEPLSRGGSSSGLLSFLRVGDRAAGAVKSGGTTRRAAKMVIVDADHPDIEDFIAWKPREDAKIRALHAAGFGDPKSFEDDATDTVSGQNANNSVAVTDEFMQAVINNEPWTLHARVDGSVTKTVNAADLWNQIVDAAWQCADPGLQFNTTINTWHTCKNDGPIRASNPCSLSNCMLIPTEHGHVYIDELAAMDARGEPLPKVLCFDNGEPRWLPCARAWQSGEAKILVRVRMTTSAQRLICTPEHRVLLSDGTYVEAQSLTPGAIVQGTSGVHIVKDAVLFAADDNTSVPVYDIEVQGPHNFAVTWQADMPPVVVHNSEYVFLDDTACNLASINLARLVEFPDDPKLRAFDYAAFQYAVRLWTIVLDISVSMAGYPTAEIARRSMLYRTLGLGYAALGETLVMLGIGYGMSEGQRFAADLTSLMTCIAYRTSTELAEHLGVFPRYAANSGAMMSVLVKHKSASRGTLVDEWTRTIERARMHGIRNAQVTLLAPCGTIGIVMDCETTGVEPYYSDTTVKQLAGGGYMRFVSKRFGDVLREHGHDPEDYTRRCWTVENGAVNEYAWIEPPTDLADVLVCASTLTPTQHVQMMAAVQPFLSGAISKTVNLPSTATRGDVTEMYMLAWYSGLKSIAIYRDGCKPQQPLQGRMPAPHVNRFDSREDAESWRNAAGAKGQTLTITTSASGAFNTFIDAVADASPAEYTTGLARGERELPPDDAGARRIRLTIGGHTLYLTMTEYEDGRLAEVFVTTPRTGSAVSGWVNQWAKLFSLALQHGVPLDVLTSAGRGEQFEPSGYLNGRPVSSTVDAFARVIEERYLANDIDTAPTLVDASKQTQVHTPTQPKASGHACSSCGSLDLRKSGACYVCGRCGTTTGCS